jgi:hypothetical protein
MSAQALHQHLGPAKSVLDRSGSRVRKSKVPVPRRLGPVHSKAEIVVIEEGALTGALPARPVALDQTVVVAQTSGETVLQLVERAVHRIEIVARSGAEVGQVSVFLGSEFDQSTMAARRLLSSAVLAYANSARRSSELVFVGRWQDRDLRQQLWQLVETLVTEPGSAKVPIRLRFIHEAPPAAS